VEVAVTGIDTLDDLSRSLAGGMDAKEALWRFVSAYTDALEEAIPVRSGNLKRSIRVQMNAEGALIETGAPYSLFVIQGVQAGYMTGLIGHTISFIAKDGEKITRKVTRVGDWGGRKHWWRPATPPNNYFLTALDAPKVTFLLQQYADAGMPIQVAMAGMP
jgi:hypothetical protein